MENDHVDIESLIDRIIAEDEERRRIARMNAGGGEEFLITLHNDRTNLTGQVFVVPDNTLAQIAEAAGELLGIIDRSPGIEFEVDSGPAYSNPNLTVRDVGLHAGSVLRIYEFCGPEATIVVHFGTIYNTVKRLDMEAPTKREQCRQHKVTSMRTDYHYQFSISESTLADLVHPYDWKPAGYGDRNLFVEDDAVRFVINETRGTVAAPKDFQMRIWDFAQEDDALRIVPVLDPEANGMPLTSFAFGDDEPAPPPETLSVFEKQLECWEP